MLQTNLTQFKLITESYQHLSRGSENTFRQKIRSLHFGVKRIFFLKAQVSCLL
jgi:hypothetical protein